MAEPKKTPLAPDFDLDKELQERVKTLVDRLKSQNVRPDFRGEYFSNRQVNDLRDVLETKGFAIAKQFQSARIQPKDNKWDRIKNEVLLDFLEQLEVLKLDLVTAAFIIGKINPIIGQQKDKKASKS